jgi:uncharacterized membrane protein
MRESESKIDEDQQEGSVRPEIIAVSVVAIVIGIATRFITRSSLWLDEALSVQIASLPLGEISEALKHDGHPPLYYVLLHGWMEVFGTSDLAVRSLSAIIGLATLPLVWFLGRRKGGPTLAWVAVAVVAVSPFAVRYSSETRMYSLVILLVVVGWLLLDDVIDRGATTISRYIGIVIVSTALLYTHYWSLWLLGAVGITALWKIWRADSREQRRPWSGVVISLLVGLLLFIPWIPTMLYQSANTGTPWAKASRPTSAFSITLADNGAGSYGEQALAGALFLLAMILGLFGYAIDRRTTALDLRTRPALRGAAWIAGLAFALGCIVSFASSSAYASRYSAVVFPMLALLAAAGCICFSARWIRFGVVSVFCGVLAIGAVWTATSQRTQIKELADVVSASYEPGDIVVVCPDQLGPASVRVLPKDISVVSYPDYGDGRFVDWVGYEDRNLASSPEEFASKVLTEAGNSKSIYVVWNTSYKTFEGKCEALVAALSANRPPEQLVDSAGNRFFEHAALTRFPAPA